MMHQSFSKLQDIQLHVLKLKILGCEDIFFKSKNYQALQKILNNNQYYDYEIKTFTVKDTFEVDDDHVLCGINSLNGILV